MKQAVFKGFGATGTLRITPAIAPVNMTDEVITLCKGDEAAAVRWCIRYAKKRYGYTQLQVALRCGWRGESYLSEIKSGVKSMPPDREENFALATGCNLLAQVKQRNRIAERMDGRETANDRDEAVVARMLEVAARAA